MAEKLIINDPQINGLVESLSEEIAKEEEERNRVAAERKKKIIDILEEIRGDDRLRDVLMYKRGVELMLNILKESEVDVGVDLRVLPTSAPRFETPADLIATFYQDGKHTLSLSQSGPEDYPVWRKILSEHDIPKLMLEAIKSRLESINEALRDNE